MMASFNTNTTSTNGTSSSSSSIHHNSREGAHVEGGIIMNVVYTTAYVDALNIALCDNNDTDNDIHQQIQHEILEYTKQIFQIPATQVHIQSLTSLNQVILSIADSKQQGADDRQASGSSNRYGVVACENSETGSFRTVYELLKQHQLYIVGEFAVTSSHSSPSLSQQQLWLATRYIIISTQKLSQINKSHHHHPSPHSAMHMNTLTPAHSTTSTSQSASYKTTCIMRLKHTPGSVFKAISCFALRDVNILKFSGLPAASSSSSSSSSLGKIASTDKISSLTSVLPPAPSSQTIDNTKWEYQFLVDFEPSVNIAVNEAVERSLQEFSLEYHLLGTYRSNLQSLYSNSPSTIQENQMLNILPY